MKKLLSLVLLTLCLTGCGETTVSYKASKSHSITEPSLVVPTYSVNYNDPNLYLVDYNNGNSNIGVDYFYDFIYENGCYYGAITKPSTNIPDMKKSNIRMVTPDAVVFASKPLPTGVYIYSVNEGEHNFMLYNEAVISVPSGYILQAGLWDYDENGTPDLIVVTRYDSAYQIGLVNLNTYYQSVFLIITFQSAERYNMTFHFAEDGFYISDAKLTYKDGKFSVPGLYENQERVLI